jgi:hypothetical protein
MIKFSKKKHFDSHLRGPAAGGLRRPRLALGPRPEDLLRHEPTAMVHNARGRFGFLHGRAAGRHSCGISFIVFIMFTVKQMAQEGLRFGRGRRRRRRFVVLIHTYVYATTRTGKATLGIGKIGGGDLVEF